MSVREPVTLTGQKTRAYLESVAREVIAEKGRDAFTMSDITDRAHCSVGTVYRYFSNRIDVLDAVWADRDVEPLAVAAHEAIRELDKIEDRQHVDIDGMIARIDWSRDIVAGAKRIRRILVAAAGEPEA